MIPSIEDRNRIHLYYISREYCANIEMGDVVELAGVKLVHKSSHTRANGERVYTYVATHSEQGWRVYIKIRATADSFSTRIDRQYPAGCVKTHVAVNNWMADVCA